MLVAGMPVAAWPFPSHKEFVNRDQCIAFVAGVASRWGPTKQSKRNGYELGFACVKLPLVVSSEVVIERT